MKTKITDRVSIKKRRELKKYGIDFMDEIMFRCHRCSLLLLIWFDGIEYDISGLKCENCGEVHQLKEFLILHEEEIKKKYIKDYGRDPSDLRKEFDRSIREAGITGSNRFFDGIRILKRKRFFK